MNYKKITFIIFCLIITIIYFNNTILSLSLIVLMIVFSFIYQIIFSDYPLSQYKILSYTISIVLLLSVLLIIKNKIPFCEQLNNCTKIMTLQKKGLNGTK